jgi:hypothetical protein
MQICAGWKEPKTGTQARFRRPLVASAADDLAVIADQSGRTLAAPPRILDAGDGDGRADLSLWPQGDGVIDVSLTSPLGKPVLGAHRLWRLRARRRGGHLREFADRDTAKRNDGRCDHFHRTVQWQRPHSGVVHASRPRIRMSFRI